MEVIPDIFTFSLALLNSPRSLEVSLVVDLLDWSSEACMLTADILVSILTTRSDLPGDSSYTED